MIDRVRILIVEDDAALASGIARILEREGHAVDVMATGEHAVLGARQERFDLVILDIGLPGIDGFEVLRRLRASADRVPVLVLTARDALDDRVRGLDLGADDYMAKPFAMPELAARGEEDIPGRIAAHTRCARKLAGPFPNACVRLAQEPAADAVRDADHLRA